MPATSEGYSYICGNSLGQMTITIQMFFGLTVTAFVRFTEVKLNKCIRAN